MRKSPQRPRNAASAANGSKSLNNRFSAPLSPSLRRSRFSRSRFSLNSRSDLLRNLSRSISPNRSRSRFSRSRFSLNSRSDLLRNLSRSINPNPRRISRILSLRPKNLSLKSKNISRRVSFRTIL